MRRDDDVFAEALDLPETERAAFLNRACAGQPEQRARVEALLRGSQQAPAFLNATAISRLATSPEEVAGERIDRYKLLEKIGEGGCGVVWMAEQEEPVRRRVALKVIKLGMDTKEVIARFEAERQALALMDHPNIAHVHDGGTTEKGRPYFVMELVRGVPITRYCDDHQLTAAERLRLFSLVCHAVQHAHQKGIIHRDLKPSNILVTLSDGAPVPKVIDFGIAKATQGRLTDQTLFTAFQQFIGTPAYMSPEQADMTSDDVDTRSDVYSLGVLLYELLTGAPPFDAKALVASGIDQIRRTIREVDPPRPSSRLRTLSEGERSTLARQRSTVTGQLVLALSGDLDWIVMKALEKHRSRRYESASAFAADIQRFLGHEPVAARPPSTAYLLQKLVRRHRIAFAAGAVVLLTLLLGVAVSTWQAVRARRAEAVALRGEQEQSRLRANEAVLRSLAEQQERRIRRRAYASDMNLAQQALALDNLGRARELLDRYRPGPNEPDLRGWEWRYLWQFTRSEDTAVFLENSPMIGGLKVSPDGEWLMTWAWPDSETRLWNLRTREKFPVPLPFEILVENTFAFSPDAPLVALGTRRYQARGGELKLWNYLTRQVIGEWAMPKGVNSVWFSPDGQQLLARGEGEAVLLSVPWGTPIKTFQDNAGNGWWPSPDFSFALRVVSGGTVLARTDLTSGRERWVAQVTTDSNRALAFSPDGSIFAVAGGGRDLLIRLFDSTSGREIGSLEGHREPVRQLIFWDDGKTLAAASLDQTIRLWDVGTRRLIRTLRGHTQGLLTAALLPDQKTLISAAGDGTVRLWDTTSVRAPGSKGSIEVAARAWRFSPDGSALTTAESSSGEITEWRGLGFSERRKRATLGPASGPIERSVALAPDQPLAAIGRRNGRIQVWDYDRNTQVAEFATGADSAYPVGFRENNRKLLVSTERNVAVTQQTKQTSGAGNPAALVPNTQALLEWEISTGLGTRQWPRSALRGDYVLSRDGQQCLLRPTNILEGINFPDFPLKRPPAGPTTIIDLDTGAERPLPRVDGGRGWASFSLDGSWLATPTVEATTIWETATFEPVRRLSGTIRPMNGAAFSSDRSRIISASSGAEAVWIWDTEIWELVLTLGAADQQFTHTEFSPDGSVIASSTMTGRIHFWRAPSWAEIEAAEKAGRER